MKFAEARLQREQSHEQTENDFDMRPSWKTTLHEENDSSTIWDPKEKDTTQKNAEKV